MIDTKPLRVACYARVSSEEQGGREHFSIAAQFSEMREYAQRRHWEVSHEFVDEGISGTRADRPGLVALLKVVTEKQCDVIMVHELSRLSRSLYHTLEFFQTFGQYQIGFASVKEPNFTFADPTQRLFLTILAAVNQYYLDLLRMHIRKSKRQRVRSGLYNAPRQPYGYEAGPSSIDPPTIIPAEAEVVKYIFERYATGVISHQQIADELNQKGIPWRKASGKHRNKRNWGQDNVGEMIRHPFYVGKVVYKSRAKHPEIYPGQHEPIISEELWEQVNQVRANRNTGENIIRQTTRVYLLAGLARCDVCGRRLRSITAVKTGVAYYRDVSLENGYYDCPHARTGTRATPVDTDLHQVMRNLRLPAAWLAEIRQLVEDESALANLDQRRRQLENRRRRLKEMRIAGEFDDDADLFNQEMTNLRQELSELPTRREIELLANTLGQVNDLPATWDQASLVEQRDLLRLMLDGVLVDVPGAKLVAIQPLPAFQPLFRVAPGLRETTPGTFVPVSPPGQNESSASTDFDLRRLVVENPLRTAEKARIHPGVSKALADARANGLAVGQVLQITGSYHPLALDLRKWRGAQALSMSWSDFAKRPAASADLLISQFLLWESALAKEAGQAVVAAVFQALRPGGVWYAHELLPLEMLDHPALLDSQANWDWAAACTWNLYTLYNWLQEAGFVVGLKRQRLPSPQHLTMCEFWAARPGAAGVS